MSTIYLPNGGHIVIHNEAWTQTSDPNTRETTYHDNKKTFLGSITHSGVVHLTTACRHTYFPPNSLDQSIDIVTREIRKLPGWKLQNLKKVLTAFNAKSCTWE